MDPMAERGGLSARLTVSAQLVRECDAYAEEDGAAKRANSFATIS
jgi:hypothetical protein